MLTINVHKKVNEFIFERRDQFPKVTSEQKLEWIKNVEEHLDTLLDDNETFYCTMPESVEEK